jgi:hypothetical protein
MTAFFLDRWCWCHLSSRSWLKDLSLTVVSFVNRAAHPIYAPDKRPVLSQRSVSSINLL